MEHLLTVQDWCSIEMLQEQKLTNNQDFETFPKEEDKESEIQESLSLLTVKTPWGWEAFV